MQQQSEVEKQCVVVAVLHSDKDPLCGWALCDMCPNTWPIGIYKISRESSVRESFQQVNANRTNQKHSMMA
jgi:hypothetical protein